MEAMMAASTTVTFRVDPEIKRGAEEVFDALGLNLSVGINMFLRQVVRDQKYPCALDLDIADSAKDTYSAGFWKLFGSGKNLDVKEPRELKRSLDARREEL